MRKYSDTPSINLSELSEPQEKKYQKFPLRACINIALIFLSTLQVILLIHSTVYTRSELIRSFLSIYYDDDIYPALFNGEAYYVEMLKVNQIKEQLQFSFSNIRTAQKKTFMDMSYKYANIQLRVQYNTNNNQEQNIYPVDSMIGIKEPFDMSNITSIQLFLLKAQLFQLNIRNISLVSQGFKQKYVHIIQYQYIDQVKLTNQFEFTIDNEIPFEQERPQVRTVVFVRLLNAFVFALAVVGLYLNYKLIRRTYQCLYEGLGLIQMQEHNEQSDYTELHSIILAWITKNNLHPRQLSFQNYLQVLEFDIVFSSLSNIFQIIGSFFLVSGIQRQKLVGVGCLFAWLTIFKYIRKYRHLILMYQLIKLSIIKVTLFFVQFLPVFIAYSLLGMCLFPKVLFFAGLDNSITTLVSLMLGDSIQMITNAIIEKNSKLFAVTYIFSFVLLFMHAIHNTLTSLIKQYFIIKKVQLIEEEKRSKKEEDYIYIEEMMTQSEMKKKKLPIKLTLKLQKQILRIRYLQNSNKFKKKIKNFFIIWDKILKGEKWTILDHKMNENQFFYTQTKRRLSQLLKFKQKLIQQVQKSNYKSGYSLMTDQ